MTYEVVSEKYIEAELARRHHLDFMRFMWRRTDKFIVGMHTERICEAIDGAIEKYRKGISSYLAIKVPFRHGKSDIASRYLPANFIGKFPDDEIIIAGYAYSLVKTFSRFSRSIVEDEKYQYVYPGVVLDQKQRSLEMWAMENSLGATHWLGLGGGATGKGSNLLLLDDFCKGRLEAESEVYRERIYDAFTDDLFTRRAPVSIVIILATPWHVDDIFGRIEKNSKLDPNYPQFQELKFPAKSKSYPKTYLFTDRFPPEWYLSQYAVLGPYASAGLLDCDPIARGGNVFEVDKIKYYDVPPDDIRWCRGWDLASTEKQRVSEDPDYTVGAKVGVRWVQIGEGEQIPQIYVDDIIRGRWAAPTRNKLIKSTTIGDGPGVQVAIEAYGPYKDAYDEVAKSLFGVRKIKKSQMPGDKVTKSSHLEGPMAAGNFFVRRSDSWNSELVKEFRESPGSKHDDIRDAVAVAFDGHDPYEKRVWPQFQGSHILNYKLDWTRAETEIGGSLHYAGMWQKKDLSVWVVLGLWDSYTGYLFLYDAFMCSEAIPGVVVEKLAQRMRLKTNRSEAIICNDLMWEDKGYTKNTAIQYRKYMAEKNVPGRLKQPFKFDEYASIVEVGQLFDMNMIKVHSIASSLILQLISWVTIDMGRQTGSRPDEENDGFCRALCVLVSDLRKQERWDKVMKPKFSDYNKATIVQKQYQIASEIGTRKTV